MLCPLCGYKTETLDTRRYDDPKHVFEYVERKRRCLNEECLDTFKTIEVSIDTWSRMTE